MHARSLACAALVACLVLCAPAPVRAGDAAADRLAAEWSRASDEQRAALLAGVADAPSRAAIDALVSAARSSLGVKAEAERLRRSYEADPAAPAREKAEAEQLTKTEARERDALARLATTVGRLLDRLSEGDASVAAKDLLRDAPDPALRAYRAWVGEAIGASRLGRTAIPLIDAPIEARKEIVKLQGQRAEPARKLEEVIKKIIDATDRYLKAARAKGDDSGMVPVGLVGTLPDQRDELAKTVDRLGNAIEAADERRLTAREALSRMLAGMPAAESDRVLDLIANRLLRDDDVENRAFGWLAIGSAPGPRPLSMLLAAADGKDPRDAAAALEAMVGRAEPEAQARLSKAVLDEGADWRVRVAAAVGLARTGRATAVPPLLDAMKTAKGRLLDDLREALVTLTGQAYPAVEAAWRAWWDVAGKDFRGPSDPKPEAPKVPGEPGGKPTADPAAAKGDDGFQFYGIQSHSTKVLFVLDFSGSMMWAGSANDEKVKKIDVLRSEMRKSLAGLPDGATFGVVAFSGDVRPWKKEPQVRSSKTAAEALLWIEKAPVDGGTNIGDALEVAFKMMGAGLQKDRTEAPAYDTVFFMTDGKPTVGKVTDTRQILGSVRRWNEGRRVRIHVVGMGGHAKKADRGGAGRPPGAPKDPKEDDLDVEFLKALAEQNGGQCVIH